MHIYAFGSVCRGEVTRGSDVDLLAITDGSQNPFDASVYSIYSYARLRDLWAEGNPFAWHLSLEARLLFAENGTDFIAQLGTPAVYRNANSDLQKFSDLFDAARRAIERGSNSVVFELSTMFLSVRNFATCYTLKCSDRPEFSRQSALALGDLSLKVEPAVFEILERARILSTRGIGTPVSVGELAHVVAAFNSIREWMDQLLSQAGSHDRTQ